MEFEALRLAAVLVLCAAAAYTDLKKGLIYDKITYPAILFGAALNIATMWGSWLEIAEVFGIAAAVFAAGYVLYYFGKLGGGDVKLITAIALVMPFWGGTPFVLQAVFYAVCIASVALAVYYVGRHLIEGVNWHEELPGILRAVFLGLPLWVYVIMLSKLGVVAGEYMALWFAPLACGIVFMAFERGIRRRFFLREVSIGELEDDDIIAVEFMDRKYSSVLRRGMRAVIGTADIARLKDAGLRSVLVYRDMPKFGPFVLVGAAVAAALPWLFGKMLGL